MKRLYIIFLLISLVHGEIDDIKIRIKGGVVAEPGEFRYHVSLQLDGNHVCGGALISRKHVLTAASCLHPIMKNSQLLIPKTKVLVGTISLRKNGYYIGISRVSVHPEYQYNDLWESYINDIGIVHLQYEVPRTYWVNPINLPTKTEVFNHSRLVITGWDANMDSTRSNTELLNKAMLQHIDTELCQTYFIDRRIADSQICTSANYFIGTCTTDTGSPLVYQNELIGISTAFHGCARGVPDVFTKVSYFLKYIHEELDIANSR